MLHLVIPAAEFYDEAKEEFVQKSETSLTLEHSLISISKWESRWGKPFLGSDEKTEEQTFDYIRCMNVNNNTPKDVYARIQNEQMAEIQQYIDSKQTATWFREGSEPPNREIITSEVIYYWMIELNIPFECQRWHLNRLLTLIRVINEKRKPSKAMSTSEIISRNKSLNAQRLKQYNTRG